MAQLSIVTLVGLIFGIIVIVVLVAISVSNLRAGARALARARSAGEQVVWHKQLSILFGLNNLVFASLILTVILLAIVTDRTLKYVFLALIALFLLLSIFLVTRCVLTALQTSRDLVSSRKDKHP